MKGGKCRACGGPSILRHKEGGIARPLIVGLSLRSPGKRRAGDFEFCPRCVALSASPELPASVSDALLMEFRALL